MSILRLLFIPIFFGLVSLIPAPKQFTRFNFVLGALVLAVLSWIFVVHAHLKSRIFAFGENLMMDPLAALFVLLIVSIGALSAIYAAGYLFREGESAISPLKLRRYAFFFHLFLLTMLLTVLSNNLGVMWIAIEGTTLASAFLVNVDDKKARLRRRGNI